MFFLPQEGVEFLVLDGEVAEVVSLQPNRGLIKIRGKALGETEIFLYRLSPLRANRIRVVVTEESSNLLEGLLYPSIFDSRTPEVYLCRYLSLLNSGDFGLYLELVYPDEGRFIRTYLWDYPSLPSLGMHVDCVLTDPSLFSKGLQEILLCGGDFYTSCVRHVFFVE